MIARLVAALIVVNVVYVGFALGAGYDLGFQMPWKTIITFGAIALIVVWTRLARGRV